MLYKSVKPDPLEEIGIGYKKDQEELKKREKEEEQSRDQPMDETNLNLIEEVQNSKLEEDSDQDGGGAQFGRVRGPVSVVTRDRDRTIISSNNNPSPTGESFLSLSSFIQNSDAWGGATAIPGLGSIHTSPFIHHSPLLSPPP